MEFDSSGLDELHDAFNELTIEFEKVSLKNNFLKKKIKSLEHL